MNKTLIALFAIIAITSTQAININLQCASDIFGTFPTLQNLVSDIQSQNIPKVLIDVAGLLQLYPQIAADCGLSKQLSFLQDIQGSATTCSQDLATIVAVVEQISQNPTDIAQDIADFEKLFQTLQNVQTDCTFTTTTYFASDIGEFLENLF